MARLALIGGAYAARSVIANCQRAINYFPEPNSKDSPVPVTHYQRPGLKPLVSPGAPAAGRGLYRATNGNGYCVIGQNVYSISSTWSLTLLGQVTTGRNNICSFSDNGQQILLVDGSPNGWTLNIATHSFSQIFDPTRSF